jgi:hypothetical protein
MDDHDEECEEFKMKHEGFSEKLDKMFNTDWLQKSLAFV